MSNQVIDKIGHDIEVAGKDVAHVVEWPFARASQMVSTLTAAINQGPAVRAAIVGLVQQAEAVDADAVAVLAAKGVDVGEDVATLQAVAALFAYFKNSFLPVVEAAYKDIQSAIAT
jgi:ABC-type transporter Mla subunit MlaD